MWLVMLCRLQLEQSIVDFAEGLRVFGLEQGQTVSLFSDNSHRWIVADQGKYTRIMTAGASDAVRGAKAPPSELLHIATHSDSSVLVVENVDLLAKLAPQLQDSPAGAQIKFAVLLWGTCKSASEELEAQHEAEAEAQSQLNLPFPIYTFKQLIGAGHTSRHALAAADGDVGMPQRPLVRPDDIATLVYTSGTTGNPKAVMLTHANLLHQVRAVKSVVSPEEGDTVLSLLPPWHMYERALEYFTLSNGVRQVYSSVKTFKEDLTVYPPDYFIAVPLVYDILYNGVQKKLAESDKKKKIAGFFLAVSQRYMDACRVLRGLDLESARRPASSAVQSAGQLALAAATAALLLPLHLLAVKLVYSKIRAALNIRKATVSGGGSLATNIDRFFEAIGICVLNGYGLTETSPVLTARKPESNTLGSVGPPLPGTEVKVVDPETGRVLSAGAKGIVKARGPQIMKGYYKNPSATIEAIDEEGWFNTGDLGWLIPHRRWGGARNCGGHLGLEGGESSVGCENVEPAHIEEAALMSKVVQQIMLVGQAAGRTHTHERIGAFVLLDEPFSVDNGLLTPTMKMRRDVIAARYILEISALYNNTS
eukprot:jgi/Mesen1/5965/ME000301S05096